MSRTLQERVTKEDIPALHFVHENILTNENDLKRVKQTLEHAADMSHSFYTKTRVVFETEEGTKEVLTTIWAATDHHILLKGGISIPMSCVVDVIVD